MELTKVAYKQTEVGLIPEDWNVKEFSEIFKVNQGLQIAIEQRFKHPSPNSKKYITIQFLNEGKAVEYINDYSESVCCTEEDVLMTRTGNTGMVVTNVNGVFHNNFFKINFNREKLNKDYIVFFLNQNTTQKKILERAGTSTIPDLNHNDFYSLEIPLPPTLTEQKAIATALSDIDALISSLEKLITKKKAIKQGAMQQLLTPPNKGGKRLDGFSGEWEESTLGGYCDLITKGTTPTSLGRNFTEIGVNFIKAESINKIGTIINEKVAFIDSETHNILSRSKMQENDLLFTIAGVLGRIGVMKKENLPANTNQAVAIIRLTKSLNLSVNFFFHILRVNSIEKHIEAISVQGAQANFSLTNVADIPLVVPKSFNEQKAIAEILSDMDKELEGLETKKAKYQNIKSGMMQELLTGKTRLV